MINIKLLVLLTLGSFTYVAGQTPSSAPTPPPADETDVVKITTTLVQFDVTVTDKNGNIVTDLRPDEVEIFENGKKQTITNFSFISNGRTLEQAVTVGKPVLPAGPARPEKVRRTIAIVIDDLNLSFESTHFVRRALKKFVDEQMQDGDLVAIIRTGAGIGALQQFTQDKRQLYAAIERVRWNPAGAGNIGAFAPLQARPDDDESMTDMSRAEALQKEQDDFRESLIATGTLGAINYVVRGMRELPGRKSIMLMSDGFSLESRGPDGFREGNRVLQALRRLIDLANRSSVVIYTMDARGLQYTGLTAADSTAGHTLAELENEMANRRSRLLDTQDGLRFLAQQTGGLPIVNTNDLSGGIRRVLDDQSYYLVAYEPDPATFDPKLVRFNRMEIRVKRPNTRVRHRSGFFGVSDEKMLQPPQTTAQRLFTALSSPFALQDIPLRLNALFFNSSKEGNMIRSLVHIPAQDLTFTDLPDGGKKAVFDILAVGFGDNGIPVDQISKTYTLTIKKASVQDVATHGLTYDFTFPIKKPGAYQLRVALRDHGSDKIGSANQFVEVPNLKKGILQLSGVALQNMSVAEWQKLNSGVQSPSERSGATTDTSQRQFKRGSVLSYGLSIYNAKQSSTGINLSSQTRMFRDGQMIFEGKVQPVTSIPGADPKAIPFSSALALGSEMVPGDYVLQIVITDNMAKAKRNTLTQFVQFEIIQ